MISPTLRLGGSLVHRHVQTIPRTLRLNAPPVWLEALGARRSAATIGSMTAAATAQLSPAIASSWGRRESERALAPMIAPAGNRPKCLPPIVASTLSVSGTASSKGRRPPRDVFAKRSNHAFPTGDALSFAHRKVRHGSPRPLRACHWINNQSCCAAPANLERTERAGSVGSCAATYSFATRFIPSRIGVTSPTAARRYSPASTDRG